MSRKRTAAIMIVGILAIGSLVMGGLHYFAEHGQFTPASTTGGGLKSDQKPGAGLRTGN